MKHLILISLLVLTVLLPLAESVFFGAAAVALGIGALLIAKGFIIGALLAGAARNNNDYYYSSGRSYYDSYPTYYTYRRYGRRRRSALVEVAELHNKYGVDKDQWFLDISTKDKDDCGKRMVCELTARHTANATSLKEDERVIVETFSGVIDVKKGQIEFDVAAKVGRDDGELRCAELYKRCETPVDEIMEAIRLEMEEINTISQTNSNNSPQPAIRGPPASNNRPPASRLLATSTPFTAFQRQNNGWNRQYANVRS